MILSVEKRIMLRRKHQRPDGTLLCAACNDDINCSFDEWNGQPVHYTCAEQLQAAGNPIRYPGLARALSAAMFVEWLGKIVHKE